MEREKAKAVLEAILFTMGEAVECTRLSNVIEETPAETRNILNEMKQEYAGSDRGIDLIELNDSFQLCTKGEMYEYLIKIAKTPRQYVLTDTVLETLSVIAYKQPVTKLEIEKIRGVNCDHAVNRLIELDLVQELGRKDAPGRPILFGTTEQLLRSFGIQSLEELPALSAVQIEEFKVQVMEEADAQQENPETVDI